MNNADLKREADLLIQRCRLSELLRPYPAWFVGGSYSYDLMCWRDLDIYALDPERDLQKCFRVGYELTERLSGWKSRFTNNVGNSNGEPNGFYWGIKLGDVRKGAWKLDVWFLDGKGYDEHLAYSANMREKLNDENRSIILAIKEAYWQRPAFRDTVTSDMIYRAVLDESVRTISEFERLSQRQRRGT